MNADGGILKSPRSVATGTPPMTPKGSVKFAGEPSTPSLPSARRTGPTSTPLKKAAPTAGTVLDRITLIHNMIIDSELAPLVKKRSHVALFDADRMIMESLSEAQRKSIQARRRPVSPEAEAAANGGLTVSQLEGPGRRRPGPNGSVTSGGNSTRPRDVTSDGGNSRSSPSPLRDHPAQVQSWNRFIKCLNGKLSRDEVELLSLTTVKQLMKHYGMDRDPVEVANIELYWRVLAQRREDERNKKAIMHKNCSAVSPPSNQKATRTLSKTFDKSTDQRR